MIPVIRQPEPEGFDRNVRQPGLEWLRRNGLDSQAHKPAHIELRSYWTSLLPELYQAYKGICAYLAIFFERATGAATTDHFVAKSKAMGQAYEWSNFRLACLEMNRKKGVTDQVLDPFEIQPETFRLELSSGEIFPNPDLPADLHERARRTIELLGLDEPIFREMRSRHFQDQAARRVSAEYLASYSPFVYIEARRQNLLRS